MQCVRVRAWDVWFLPLLKLVVPFLIFFCLCFFSSDNPPWIIQTSFHNLRTTSTVHLCVMEIFVFFFFLFFYLHLQCFFFLIIWHAVRLFCFFRGKKTAQHSIHAFKASPPLDPLTLDPPLTNSCIHTGVCLQDLR